jgi:hypothetical protein
MTWSSKTADFVADRKKRMLAKTEVHTLAKYITKKLNAPKSMVTS